RVSSHRDASVQPEQLVPFGEDALVIPFRPEETDLEVLEHPDSPQDRAALHVVLAGGCLEARKEVLPVREFHEHHVSFASRLHVTHRVSKASDLIRRRRSTALASSFALLNAVYTRRGRHARMKSIRSSKSAWSLRGNCASTPYRRVKSNIAHHPLTYAVRRPIAPSQETESSRGGRSQPVYRRSSTRTIAEPNTCPASLSTTRKPLSSISFPYGSACPVPPRRTLRTSRVCGVMMPPDVRWSMCPWLTTLPGVLRTGSKMTSLRRSWTRIPPS